MGEVVRQVLPPPRRDKHVCVLKEGQRLITYFL